MPTGTAVFDLDSQRLREMIMFRGKPDMAYKSALDHIIQCVEGHTGCLAMLDAKQEFLTLVTGVGLPDSAIGSKTAIGDGVFGWVARAGQALVLNGDISKDPRFSNIKPRSDKARNNSSLCWPLRVDDRIVGVISVNRPGANPEFNAQDLENGGVIVDLVAVIVENAHLHASKMERIETLNTWSDAQRHLNQVDEILKTDSSLEPLHQDIIDDAMRMCQARYGIFLLFDENATLKSLVEHATDESTLAVPDRQSLSLAAIEGAFENGATLCLRQGDADLKYALAFPCIRKFNSLLAVPLVIDGAIRGALCVTDKNDQEAFSANDEILLAIYADQVRRVFERVNLHEQLKQKNEALLREQRDQRELIVKLQAAQDQLLQSEKMASIGLLAAGVAHEINNPVGYITSNIGTLKKYMGDIFSVMEAYEKAEPMLAQYPEVLEGICALKKQVDIEYLKSDSLALMSESQEGVTRVKKIVQDLKDFSHVDNAEWQIADLHHGIDSTLNIVHNEIKYKAEVVKQYGDIPQVECLPSQLNQVFLNLLVNAAHAIEERGVITVATGKKDSEVWIAISDTGKGIAAENLKRIFDPFFTTKPIGTGTGLGLSLSYGIIQKHTGRMEVESEVGKGTTFRLWLPIKAIGEK